jgi:hypothetical protein
LITIFETPGVYIRQIIDLDFADLALFFMDKKIEDFMGCEVEPGDVVDFIEYEKSMCLKDDLGFFMLLEKNSGKSIGMIKLIPVLVDEEKTLLFQYYIKSEYEQGDYESEIIDIVLSYAFERYDFCGAAIYLCTSADEADAPSSREFSLECKTGLFHKKDHSSLTKTIFFVRNENYSF